jgi:hypothetical protein
LAL